MTVDGISYPRVKIISMLECNPQITYRAAMAHRTDESLAVMIPLDAETFRRLVMLSRAVADDPITVAASLLHDILRDDEYENVLEMLPNRLHS